MYSHRVFPCKGSRLCRGLNCHLFGKTPYLSLRRSASVNPCVNLEFVPACGPQQAGSYHICGETRYPALDSSSTMKPRTASISSVASVGAVAKKRRNLTYRRKIHDLRSASVLVRCHSRSQPLRHCPQRARSPTTVGRNTAATVATPRQLSENLSRPSNALSHREKKIGKKSEMMPSTTQHEIEKTTHGDTSSPTPTEPPRKQDNRLPHRPLPYRSPPPEPLPDRPLLQSIALHCTARLAGCR